MTPANPAALLDAIGELALAIMPHHMDADRRAKVAKALHVLVDHILAQREKPNA